MSTGEGWAPLEADGGVRAWGSTRASAFAQAAQGVLALLVKPEEVAEREHREVRAQGQSPEQLLFNWITECLYVHEIEGFVVRRVEVDACSATVIHGVLHGEELDTNRHHLGTRVRAATTDQLSVVERDGLHELRIGIRA